VSVSVSLSVSLSVSVSPSVSVSVSVSDVPPLSSSPQPMLEIEMPKIEDKKA
jgi:hypothetical protein